MADRILFKWKDAAIMGKDRPQYVTVGPDFPGGSPVWGENGVIAALLARVAEVEAERDRLRMVLEALVGLVDQHNGGLGEFPIAANTLAIARGLLRATAPQEEEVLRAE